MKLEWAIFCKRGIIDRSNDLTTLVDILNAINVNFSGQNERPTQIPFDLSLATRWKRTGKPCIEEVKVQVKSGTKSLIELPLKLDLESAEFRISIVSITHIPVTHNSVDFVFYRKINDQWKKLTSARLPIVVQTVVADAESAV